MTGAAFFDAFFFASLPDGLSDGTLDSFDFLVGFTADADELLMLVLVELLSRGMGLAEALPRCEAPPPSNKDLRWLPDLGDALPLLPFWLMCPAAAPLMLSDERLG